MTHTENSQPTTDFSASQAPSIVITPDILEDILEEAVKNKASDIIIKHLHPPKMRRAGEWHSFTDDDDVPSLQHMIDLMKNLLNEKYEEFVENKEIDFQYATPHHRFRVNAGYQDGGPFLTFRPVPQTAPTLEELNLLEPEVLIPTLITMIEQPRGLVLVTGPTGSGKSTTLAALINHINKKYRKHIITIEDPVEFKHKDQMSTIEQREVGSDTNSFDAALRSALRQAPDIILVGEMRDPKTIATALTAAETGHLVISTVHTNNAPSSINRIIDAMPSDQANQIRTQLAASLVGVVTQQLVQHTNGIDRQVILEIMPVTQTIESYIRDKEGATQTQYYDHMNSAEDKGHILMDRQLAVGVLEGRIPENFARDKAMDIERLETYMRTKRKGNMSGLRFG